MKFLSVFALFGALLLASSANAEVVPVCDRTPAVADFIVKQINKEQGTKKTCAEISETDLATLKRISVARKNLETFKDGDFSGLPNLEILNIRSNPYTLLPEGLMKGLTSLKTIVIIGTPLRHYPDDFLEGLPSLENLHIFRNEVRSISESILVRLEGLENLKIIDFDRTLQDAEKERLRDIFPEGGEVKLFFR